MICMSILGLMLIRLPGTGLDLHFSPSVVHFDVKKTHDMIMNCLSIILSGLSRLLRPSLELHWTVTEMNEFSGDNHNEKKKKIFSTSRMFTGQFQFRNSRTSLTIFKFKQMKSIVRRAFQRKITNLKRW